jgi:4a-hydroxytetrahydrobiopterin dehydratase
MTTSLAAERCTECRPGTPPLTTAEGEALRPGLDERWAFDDGRLRRRLEFRSFAAAFAFAGRVALLAEREAHHPDIRVGWAYAEIELTTHAAGGLTRNDFIVAAKIDRIIESGAGLRA